MNIPFYLSSIIDSVHLDRMHTVNLLIKEETIKEPLKNIINAQTNFTKQAITHTFELIDATSDYVHRMINNGKVGS